MARLEIFWSFRSPYSYLAVDRICAISERYALEAQFRPVRPLALREPDFFEKGRSQFLPYLFKDVPREAARLGVAFAPPNPDPVVMDMATGKVAPDQPLMTRLMALGVAAAEHGAGLAFAKAVSRRIWTGAPWSDDTALGAACSEAGVEIGALGGWARAHPDNVRKIIDANEAAQLKHHWGVPLMVLDGEPFFGQDRIAALIWRLDALELARPSG